MEVILFLCFILLIVFGIAVQGILSSLKSKVGEIAESLERLTMRLDKNTTALEKFTFAVSYAMRETPSEQTAPRESVSTDSSDASSPTCAAPLASEVQAADASEELTEKEKHDSEEKSIDDSLDPVSRFIASKSCDESDDRVELDEENTIAEECVQTQQPATETETSDEISADRVAEVVAETTTQSMKEDNDVESTSVETSATPMKADNKRTSAVASVSSQRVQQLWNWLIYGHASGCSAGEAPEKLVATTWLLRLGILVIFCTAVFLLRLSIERGMLSPAGRLCLSFLAGAGILCWGMSRKMRNSYWALGQTLIGIGLGLFYFSSYALTAMYHFVAPTTAGCIMLLVTLTAGVLSERLNSIAVAMVAMVGGYATPLMLNTDSKSLAGLCFYLLLLVCGVLWLSYRKKWEQLVWLAMLFTYFLFHLGFAYKFQTSEFVICISFLTLYFILFSTSVFLYNVRNAQEVTALEIISFVANSAVYLFQSMLLISRVNNGDRLYYAPLTLGMAAFYLGHAYFFVRRNRAVERKLLLAFCALCGVYLAMTAPIVLSGHWLGAAWALQGLLMLWLGVRMDSVFLRSCGWCLYAMTLGRLCLDFFGYGSIYRAATYGVGFWTGVLARICQFGIPVACMALGGKLMLARSMQQTSAEIPATQDEKPLPPVSFSGIVLNLAYAILLFFLLFECYVDFHFLEGAYRPFALTIVLSAGVALALLASRRGVPGFWYATFVAVLLILFCKCFMLDYLLYGIARRARYDYFFSWNDTAGNLLNFATMLSAGQFIQKCLGENGSEKRLALSCRIFWPILLFLFSTTELKVVLHNTLPGLEVGGVSVLWGVFAFIAIYYGVSRGIRPMRYIGLGLFAVVVFKVFVFDLARLDPFWRVCAFLAFGILLIGAAFIYLKYWQGADKSSKEEEK